MFSKRKLFYSLSPSLRFFIRRIYFFPIDLWNKIQNKNKKNIPPKGLIFIGQGDFEKIGKHYLHLFKKYCDLQPHHHVLDVGCGIGRIALPLTDYISNNGLYEGFDIVNVGINWCRKNITAKFPNFNFIHVDLKNDLYNLSTNSSAKDFVFPYKDDSFDLVVLTSVFTHMVPEDVVNYLKEINRVLKNDGKLLITVFLLNSESKKYMIYNKEFDFKFNYGNYRLINNQVKEANVAFEEECFMDTLKQNNFEVLNKLYGSWSKGNQKNNLDFQDTLILKKNKI